MATGLAIPKLDLLGVGPACVYFIHLVVHSLMTLPAYDHVYDHNPIGVSLSGETNVADLKHINHYFET
jgi:hypothetical protein